GGPLQPNASRTELVAGFCGIPSTAQVLVGNATVVNDLDGGGPGFITLYPTGTTRPTVSNLNFVADQFIPNAFTVALGSGGANAGKLDIYSTTFTDVVLDVAGYYAPPGAGALYYH